LSEKTAIIFPTLKLGSTDSIAVTPLGTVWHLLRRFMCRSAVHILWALTLP